MPSILVIAPINITAPEEDIVFADLGLEDMPDGNYNVSGTAWNESLGIAITFDVENKTAQGFKLTNISGDGKFEGQVFAYGAIGDAPPAAGDTTTLRNIFYNPDLVDGESGSPVKIVKTLLA
jgi:hypothetical protein